MAAVRLADRILKFAAHIPFQEQEQEADEDEEPEIWITDRVEKTARPQTLNEKGIES